MAKSPASLLIDGSGNQLPVADDTAIPASTPGLLVHAEDDAGKSQRLQADSSKRLKVTVAPPTPPVSATPVVVAQAEADLSIGVNDSPDDTTYIIPNSVTFYLQTLTGGAAGDPTESGSKIEVIYLDSGSTEHLVTRLYIAGQTISSVFSDVSTARDGTAMTGDGTTTAIILRRTRLSNATQEVDAEVRGYVQ